VRNPLGVIFNAVGGIRRALGNDDRARTLVAILEEEAQRLNHIVGDLLDFARPLKPSLRTEPLLPVVREVVQTATESSAEPICVEWNVDDPLPGVPMDVRLMRQALLNVTINAVQAMHAGGTMSLRLRREESMLLLEIADTGPGIPKDMEARIFEPFFTTRPTGTGLGLTVVKRIIDVHGGTLAVSAKPGAGAVFRICLPLERAEPAAPLKA
jgi:signal transduction histidine kinase